MFQDAWRMLRDYFYDTDMTGLPWDAIFDRYLPLVERCCKREELDDGMFTCFFLCHSLSSQAILSLVSTYLQSA